MNQSLFCPSPIVGSYLLIGPGIYVVDTNTDAQAAYIHWYREQQAASPDVMIAIPDAHFNIKERSVLSFTLRDGVLGFTVEPTERLEWVSSVVPHGTTAPSNPLPENVAYTTIDEAPFVPRTQWSIRNPFSLSELVAPGGVLSPRFLETYDKHRLATDLRIAGRGSPIPMDVINATRTEDEIRYLIDVLRAIS